MIAQTLFRLATETFISSRAPRLAFPGPAKSTHFKLFNVEAEAFR